MRRVGWTAWVPLAAMLAGGPAAPAAEQLGPLVYSQPPNRLFGFGSDTAYIDDFGRLQSAIYADRFTLTQTHTIQQLVFYGFYGTQNQGYDPDPPASEAFIIRFYNERGVFPPFPPADLLYEEIHADVTRTLTGFLAAGRREYRYVVNLDQAFSASANTPYWVSIAQYEDPFSVFRWETSSGGELAFQFPIGSPWQLAGGNQLAYELRLPEPGCGALLFGGVLAAVSRRRL
jgi:hypothetical protein